MRFFRQETFIVAISYFLLLFPIVLLLLQQKHVFVQQATTITDNTIYTGVLQLNPTFHSIGIALKFTGDANKNATAALEFKKTSESSWRKGLDLWGVYEDDPAFTLFSGSSLLLESDTQYDVKITIADPDSVVGNAIVTGSVRTQADAIPQASQLTPTYFVRTDGNDTNSGTGNSTNDAWKTLQKAFEAAPEEAIVKVATGSYAYPTTPRLQPITLIGENAIVEPPATIKKNSGAWQRVTFTGPATGQQFTVWKAISPIADPNVVQIETASELPEIVGSWGRSPKDSIGFTMSTPAGWAEVLYQNDMYHFGYATFGTEIYMLLPGDRDPNTYTTRVNHQAGYESGHVVIGGANSRISGFTFNMVDLRINAPADGTVIDHNTLLNATIYAIGNPKTTPQDYPSRIVIESNTLQHTSLYTPKLDQSAIAWKWVKGPMFINGQKTEWRRVGDQHEVTAIGGRGGAQGMIIRNNHIEGYFNGIGAYSKDFNQYAKSNYDIYNNTIRWIADDVFEPDGGGMNWRVWDNKITQSSVGVSFGPAHRGPFYMFRNTFLDMTNNGVGADITGDTTVRVLGFKYSGNSNPPLLAYIINNTFESNDSDAMGGYKAAGGSGDPERFFMRNNIFKVHRYVFSARKNIEDLQGVKPLWDEDYNAWTTTDQQRGFEVGGKNVGTLERYRELTGQGMHSNPHGGLHDPIVLNADATLPHNSSLINSGIPIANIADNYDAQSSFLGLAPDMGALESPYTDRSGIAEVTSMPTPTLTITLTDTPTLTPTMTLNPSPTTLEKPVNIYRPTNGTIVTPESKITIAATAKGASYVIFSVNDTIIKIDGSDSFNTPWIVPQAPNTSYSIKAIAVSSTGQSTSHTIYVQTN
jgi:hypothetical protein